jgi:hypothetical protein
LQRLRPISALGASDSTLELAVALGHYHGALAPRLRAIVAITVTTTKKGTYSFRAKFKKKTDLRVFDPGTSGDGPPACAGSDAAKTVKVV